MLGDVRIGGIPLPPSVHLEVNTNEDVTRSGDVLASLLDETRERLLEPLRDDLARRATAFSEHVDGERLDGEPIGPHGERSELWAPALTQVADGELQRLTYVLQSHDPGGAPSIRTGQAQLQFFALAPEFRIDAAAVSVTVSKGLYASEIDDETQRAWVEVAKSAAIALRAATGYLTIGYVAGASPFEHLIGRDWLDGVAEGDRLLRGYFWGNVLSAGHVAALGGRDRVLAEAPCARAEDWSTAGHELVYLQLTADLELVPDDALLVLERYLRPVLPAPREDLPKAPDGAPATLTFKQEDETEDGDPIGPAILVIGEGRGQDVRDLGWMTLEDAAELAQRYGYKFAED